MAEVQATLDRSVAAGLLELRPLPAVGGSQTVGAQLDAVDLQRPLSPHVAAAVRAALLTHKVLVVRGQELTHAQHVAFAQSFGEVTIGHIALRTPTNAVAGHPEVFGLKRDGI